MHARDRAARRLTKTIAYIGAAIVLGGTFILSAGGCAGRFSDFCKAEAQCEGGNDKDIEACAAQAEGEEDAASAYDCGDPFDKLVDCVNRTSTCQNKSYRANCPAESQALEACEKAASAKK